MGGAPAAIRTGQGTFTDGPQSRGAFQRSRSPGGMLETNVASFKTMKHIQLTFDTGSDSHQFSIDLVRAERRI
jgi:hypothetical protein